MANEHEKTLAALGVKIPLEDYLLRLLNRRGEVIAEERERCTFFDARRRADGWLSEVEEACHVVVATADGSYMTIRDGQS